MTTIFLGHLIHRVICLDEVEVFIPSADAVETCRVCSSWGLSEGPPEPARTDFDVLPMVLFFRLSGQHGYLTLSCKQSLFTFLSIVGFVG